ncbi:MAG: hemolysin family protein [Thermomicrobium sp.]|nr:hemolysin family protein [Thermomicrobium sp.]
MSSPWFEPILFAVAAIVLVVAALTDLASCLPVRRSLREFLLELAEGQNGNGETTFEQLRAARPAVRLVQGAAFLALVLLAVRLGQRWWPTHALGVALLVGLAALVVLASALPLALLERRSLGPGRARALAVALGRVGAPLRAASDLVERGIALLVPAVPAAPVPAAAPPPPNEEAVEEAEELIERVLRLDRLTARDIMVPRTDIVAVPFDLPVREAIAVARERKHSRLPVYQGTIDRIVGIVHVRDLLRFALEPSEGVKVGDVMREAYFIPESKRVDELLRDLQRQRVHMAIVVDEFGGTAGIVTIEDVLEEIVGEIQDEYDVEAPLVERVSAEEAIVDGRISLEEIADIFGVSLEEEETSTIGGLVQAHLGHIPQPGESVTVDGLEATVLEVDGNRVRKVRVRRLPAPVPGEDDAERA